MLKKIFFATVVIATVLLIFLAVSFLAGQKPIKPAMTALPSPTPILIRGAHLLTPNPTPLNIVSTSPKDEENNFPTNHPVVVVFNRPVSPSEISFKFSPAIQANPSFQSNNLIITPLVPLEQNKTYFYTITINSTDESFVYTFATEGPNSNYQVNTGVNASQQEDDFNRKNYPDFYVADKTPYETNAFAVSSSPYVDAQGNDHYSFIVSQKTPSYKTDFLSWLHSLGLTDVQIKNLNIRYN